MKTPLKKRTPQTCATPDCNKRRAKNRTLCSTCKRQRQKEADPYKYHWQILKDNAKRRKKPFTITVEYFKQFCYETQILHGRGRTSNALHIDCIIEELGYVPGNIRPLTCAENVAKENRRRATQRKIKKVIGYDYFTGTGYCRPIAGQVPVKHEAPF